MKDRPIWPRWLVVALLVAAACGLGLPARAQEDPVTMTVVGYDRPPANPKFNVEPTQGPELTRYAVARFKAALEQHGFEYGQSAHLIMTVLAEKTGGNQPPSANFDTRTAIFHLNLDESKPPLSAQVEHAYRITLDLYDRDSGNYLWRAQIVNLNPTADPMRATDPMIAKLVNALVLWVGPSN